MTAFDLDDRQTDAYTLWRDFSGWLKEQCEASAPASPPGLKLTFRQPARTEATVFFSDSSGYDHKLHITYHPYICAIRYALDGDALSGELFVKIYTDESYIETAEHMPMTAEQAAASMLLALPLSCHSA